MLETNQNLWYDQISYLKKKNVISNGLTIPYLIGAYKVSGYSLNSQKNPIKLLFDEIINSQMEQYAVLQKCPYINQYVIGLDNKEYWDKYLRKLITFKNKKGDITLIITQNANELGDNLTSIVDKLNEQCKDSLILNRFSWDNNSKIWREFNENEKNLILEVR